MAVGFGVNVLFNPLFGHLSDNFEGTVQKYFGNRIPFLSFGVIGMIGSLLLLAGLTYFKIFPVLVLTWSFVMFFAAVGQGAYSALIPDRVLREQYGSASSWMAIMSMVGNAVGASLGFFLDDGGIIATLSIIIGTLTFCTLVTVISSHVLGVEAIQIERREPSTTEITATKCGRCGSLFSSLWENLSRPFKSGGDFTWLFFSKFFIGMGYSTIQQFILYYVEDVVSKPYVVSFFGITSFSVPDDESAAALYMLVMLASAVISALIAARLSDRIGAKVVVYISCTCQSVAVLLIILPWLHRLDAVLGVSILFGAGYGAYQSVDWALIMDVLPSNFEFGKDMGIWHISWVLPQMIVPLLGGIIIDSLSSIGKAMNYPELGYTVIFCSAIFWFLVSMLSITKLQSLNRRNGLALDPFFKGEVTWKNDEVLLNIAQSDSASEAQFDTSSESSNSTPSSSEEEIGEIEEGGTSNTLKRAVTGVKGETRETRETAETAETSNKRAVTGVGALDAFVNGQVELADIDFGEPEEYDGLL
eukprot:TRINITY_DN2220_c0_g1_i3.p1 TRINITY_DN2220_c0_g1~~TRINITY_DN2220_c0_g1_i3.p1  ORF type:complete len:531 (-),score=102.41 TRINITY_DN2220_c0_g1_i3:148-1740(-)